MQMMKEIVKMDERIRSFLALQTNFTLAVCADNRPYCANCFYAFDEARNRLIFKSKTETTHIATGLENRSVAGTITPDVLEKSHIQGIQFTGTFFSASESDLKGSQSIYYKKFPFALAVSGDLWVIELNTIKYTDNKLGFGTKINWKNK